MEETAHRYDALMKPSDNEPVLESALLVTARLWAAMFPFASVDERKMLAARIEFALLGGVI